MTELEQATKVHAEVAEVDKEIAIFKDLQFHAIRSKDEINKVVYSNALSELKRKRHNLHESVRYIALNTFTQVIKTYLTPTQYKEAWDRVDEILKTPELMQ